MKAAMIKKKGNKYKLSNKGCTILTRASNMKYVEETSYSSASTQSVWKTWAKANPWNSWEKDKSSFEVGREGHVVSKKGKGVPYKIIDIQEGKCFTILWKALFIKLIFHYSVEPEENGSKITYRVSFKGIFFLPFRHLLCKRIKKDIASALKAFVLQVEALGE